MGENAKAWAKAYHMKCVLDGKPANKCAVPRMPKATLPRMPSWVARTTCAFEGYIGCYKDKSARDLPVFKGSHKSTSDCKAACKGYFYFGMQYSGECRCGNSYGRYGKGKGCKCGTKHIGSWLNCLYSGSAKATGTAAVKRGEFHVTNHAITNFAHWAQTRGAKLVAGDFDGDGKTDAALVGGSGWGTIPVAFSKGNGKYRVTNHRVSNMPKWAAQGGAQVVAGDINGDKKDDIVCVGPRGWGTFPTAFSNGNGKFRVTNYRIAHFAGWASNAGAKLVAADFDGDGKTDAALVGARGWGTIPVAFSKGNGHYRVTNHALKKFPQWAASGGAQVAAGDFNGDKKADIVCVGPRGWRTFPTAFGNGKGKFHVTNDKVHKFAE